MSNHRAIAAVTAVLSEMVSDAIDGVVPMAQVYNLRPGLAIGNGDTGVNVYLYRAVPNPSLRNLVDPVRSGSGQLVQRPVAAWDLHYLLTCIGTEANLEPDLLLGAIVTRLNADAILQHGFIRAVETVIAEDDRRGAVGSGLADQVQLVRITPSELSIDTMTQLWSSLTSEPYALSVGYQAGAVLMTAEVGIRPPLPVSGRAGLGPSALRIPRITAIHDSAGPTHAVLIGSTLVIEGVDLRGDHTLVRIGGLDVELDASEIGVDRIELPLSPDAGSGPVPRALAPGVLGVQVRHHVDVSSDPAAPALRPAASSNLLSVVLRPQIVGTPTVDADDDGRTITVSTAPEPQPEWEHILLLNEVGAEMPRSLVLTSPSIDEHGSLVFAADEVPAGQWLVRVQVNGVDSPLRQTDGVYSDPRVTVTP